MILWCILGAVVLFFAVVIIRTIRFKPPVPEPLGQATYECNREKIVDDMSAMIRCKTVSYRDDEKIDKTEFVKFENLLRERFPAVQKACTFEKVGKTGLLYCLKGASDSKPSVCMAHYDVVPIDENGWDFPAFDGAVEQGYIRGRGTLDTKGTLCAIFEALETLLQQGYTPRNDLYLSFSGEEEIDGQTCADIVSHLEKMGVKPAIVLDEGGAVVENVFPGVKSECAVVGIGEKGGVNLDFTIKSKGGHASTPPVHTITADLAKAIVKIQERPFKRRLTKPVKEMFNTLGRHSSFLYRMIFANLWCFLPLLDFICKKSGGELNAMMRTTTAVTRLQGSDAYNVLPPKASFGVNMRLMGGDTIESATEYLKKVINNDNIDISLKSGMNPSIYSDTDCEEWHILERAIRMTFDDAIVSPYLMMACSDSRHYCKITDRVYRFSAMRLSKEERAMIHGNNEQIPIDTLIKTVEFYQTFLKML